MSEVIVSSTKSRAVRIEARPEPIEIDLTQTAIVVVDLQNGYASPGGYRALVGQDIDAARKVIDNALRLLDAARSAGLTVILLKNGWDAELKTAGGPHSPNWHKSNPLKNDARAARAYGKDPDPRIVGL
jgi:ureidoacrylate peracid hydrolase